MPDSAPSSPFFRLRWVLEITRDTEVPPHQGALLYALLAAANRRGENAAGAIPDGLLLDAPEQCRIVLQGGELFAFGTTWIEPQPALLHRRVNEVLRGLRRMGESHSKRGTGLGGNFRVAEVTDLVGGHRVDQGAAPVPISADQLTDEIRRLVPLSELTLQFTSPLRLERPGPLAGSGHRFIDREYFDASHFVRRVMRRLPSVGIERRDPAEDDEAPVEGVALIDNRLVWLDLAYGRREERKSLGGVVGRLRLRVTSDLAKAALVWGQYARVGKNLHFGFGAYRIEELGPDPYGCQRAVPLLELALASNRADEIAAKSAVASGDLRVASDLVRTGDYRPGPHRQVTIPSRDGQGRVLSIPSPLDRALQRLVLEQLGPGLDKLFENSSLAWRRGLGRERAPHRVLKAWQDGFRFALREDFDRFFDSIDHQELADRLSAYVADARLVAQILAWVRNGAPADGRGLPTGAPLSPLLGNLFLDRFDEQIAAQGCRLIRYGDDFLVLCRTEEEAHARYADADAAAEQLKLTLNSSQPEVLDFREPFQFLGFRFELREDENAWTPAPAVAASVPTVAASVPDAVCSTPPRLGQTRPRERWQAQGDAPRRLQELGWRDASRGAPAAPPEIRLPGETSGAFDDEVTYGILGPGLAELAVQERTLRCRYPGQPWRDVPYDGQSSLLVLGNVGLTAEVVGHLLREGAPILWADENGRLLGALVGSVPDDGPALRAQAAASADEPRRLAVARSLVQAKLHNYAALARSLAIATVQGTLAERLTAAEQHAQTAASLDALRGLEGAAAAQWYQHFGELVGPGFAFERRQAPAAEDPVNVLLNIGYTALYRWMLLSAQASGLAPSLGLFHTVEGRFAALAADFQESFRHLVDRAVIRATYELKPRHFQKSDTGPFALQLEWSATRHFQRLLCESWATGVTACGQSEPASYRRQFLVQARSLRRHLLEPAAPFQPFRHP